MSAKLLQLCLTLCDAMDCSPLGFSVHGILQVRILEWVAIFSSGAQGSNLGPLHWEPRVLATRSPGKSPYSLLMEVIQVGEVQREARLSPDVLL